jgi:hypothetical protein
MHIMFRFPLPVQRRQRIGYSENHSNVVQLIIRLVTNHVLLIIIIGIDCQIYSKLKLANVRFSSKKMPELSAKLIVVQFGIFELSLNRQNRSPFHMFCRFCKLHVLSGTAVAQWLRCWATNRKVVGSIPASVSGFFIDIENSSDRTMVLGTTQPLTEMSTRSISWG